MVEKTSNLNTWIKANSLTFRVIWKKPTKDTDAYSITTETSDSGMPGSHGAPSEFGMEETSGKLKCSHTLYWQTNSSINTIEL